MKLDSNVYQIIDKTLFKVYSSFGGIDNFIRSLILRYPDSELALSYLINNRRNILTINSNYIIAELENAIPEYGYEVFDFNDRLLYRVGLSNTWGNAYLDKLLFVSSGSGSIFKIRYLTFNGPRVFNIIIDRTQNINGTNTYFDVYSKEVYESNKTEELNSILATKGDLVISSLRVYQLESELTSVIDITSIKNNPSSRLEVIDTLTGEIISFIPRSNNFFYLEDDQGRPMYIDNLHGEGLDNLIYLNNGIYYCAIGENVTINTIRSLLGGSIRSESDYEYIKLIGNLKYLQ